GEAVCMKARAELTISTMLDTPDAFDIPAVSLVGVLSGEAFVYQQRAVFQPRKSPHRAPPRPVARRECRGERRATSGGGGDPSDAGDAPPLPFTRLRIARQLVAAVVEAHRNTVTLNADPGEADGAWDSGAVAARLEVESLRLGILDQVVGARS